MSKRVTAGLVAACLGLSGLVVSDGVASGAVGGSFASAPSKKYCKKHRRRCRRNIRRRHGAARSTYTLRNAKGQVLMSQGLMAACVNSGRNEFFVCNGGVKRKRGEATLHTVAIAKGNLFNDTFYKLHHRTTWRWRKKRIREVSTGAWTTNVSWYWKDEGRSGGTLGKRWYRWFAGVPRSGHRKQVAWTFESCMFWVAWCTQFHPYIRHYVHGDGTFHLSGHNW
jgi:hypothetical protein